MGRIRSFRFHSVDVAIQAQSKWNVVSYAKAWLRKCQGKWKLTVYLAR